MDAMEAIHARRAVRAYDERPVDPELVRRLLDAAVRAPSAMNAQPWAFAIVQDPALLARLSDQARAHVYADIAADERLRHLPEMVGGTDFDIFYGARTLVVVCGADRVGAAEECAMAAQNLMVAACALGLGSCPIGLARPVIERPDVKAMLGIPVGFQVVLPIIIGFPRETPKAPPRLPTRIFGWTLPDGSMAP